MKTGSDNNDSVRMEGLGLLKPLESVARVKVCAVDISEQGQTHYLPTSTAGHRSLKVSGPS